MAAATFQPNAVDIEVDDDGRVVDPADAYAGIMRLTRDASLDEISHESTHAAFRAFFGQIAERLDVSEAGSDDEEAFCYVVGELTGRIVDRFRQMGIEPPALTIDAAP